MEIKFSMIAEAAWNLVFLRIITPASRTALMPAMEIPFFLTLACQIVWSDLAANQVAGRAFSSEGAISRSRDKSWWGCKFGRRFLRLRRIQEVMLLLYGQRIRAWAWSQTTFWVQRVQVGLATVLEPRTRCRRSCVGRRLWSKQKRWRESSYEQNEIIRI